MKKITKTKQPNSLKEYIKKDEAEYDGAGFKLVKDDIKHSLLVEQGFLCAYCMRRIMINKMKIEHFYSQSKYKEKQLDYKNLLGCCLGEMGTGAKNQTCDTKKGNEDITYSPASNRYRIDDKIYYTYDGFIKSNERKFDIEINNVLNLNHHRYIENRKGILEALEVELNAKHGRRSKEQIEKMIKKYSSVNSDGAFREYNGVVLYFLNKKLC